MNTTASAPSTRKSPIFRAHRYSPQDPFSPLYLLGYMPAHNRVYLADNDLRIYGYSLSLSVVEYPTAGEILPSLQLNKVARFLESKGTPPLHLI
jgi:coatomer subunit beta'